MQEYEININLPESEVSLLMYSDSHHFQRMREIKRGGYLLEIIKIDLNKIDDEYFDSILETIKELFVNSTLIFKLDTFINQNLSQPKWDNAFEWRENRGNLQSQREKYVKLLFRQGFLEVSDTSGNDLKHVFLYSPELYSRKHIDDFNEEFYEMCKYTIAEISDKYSREKLMEIFKDNLEYKPLECVETQDIIEFMKSAFKMKRDSK